MKRINYDGQTLVTGTDVAEALVKYAEVVARMDASVTIEVPVLEDNGTVATHTLLLNSATALESFDIDGHVEDEAGRFPMPRLTPVGGKPVPISADEIADISVPINE